MPKGKGKSYRKQLADEREKARSRMHYRQQIIEQAVNAFDPKGISEDMVEHYLMHKIKTALLENGFELHEDDIFPEKIKKDAVK